MGRNIAVLIGSAALSSLGAGHASAAVNVSSEAFGFTDYPASTSSIIDFESALPAGFTLNGGLVRTLDDGLGAEPAIAENVKESSHYLSANPGDTASITSTNGLRTLSLYWGSMDAYNTVTLLDKLGGAIASYTGDQVHLPANGNQFDGETNRRVTFSTDGLTSPIYGIRFASTSPAFEVDNIGFSRAVPEPATWAMMIAGFGLVGGAMRRRRLAGAPSLA